ncbi:FGGY family carbohydrate kinase, partial [Clostridium perfringens]
MSTPLVLTFDMGTQSARAMLVDANGNIVMKSQKKYAQPYYAKEPGWAEQSANFYWESLCEVSLELKNQCGELWEDI